MASNFFNDTIKEICDEKGIEIEFLSFGYILKLKKNDNIRYIIDACFEINSSACDRILSDKYALYSVLNSEKVQIVEHNMLFNPKTRLSIMNEEKVKTLSKIYAKKYNNNVIVKPNVGREGTKVYKCNNYKEILKAIKDIFKIKNTLSICPFYNIKNEYRVVYLDGNVEIVFSKQRPYVIGDGKSRVKKLFEENKDNLNNMINLSKLEGVELAYVPKLNEKVNLTWKHNLYNGAIPEIVNDEYVLNKLNDIVKKVEKVIDMKFVTIDIIQTDTNEFMVLEINSSIGMTIFSKYVENGEIITKKIFEKAIDKMFEL